MVISTTDIQLYEILRLKLVEKEAETLVNFVDTKLRDNNNENNLKILATKEDVANLRADLVVQRSDLLAQIANTKADIIKWMFIFWLGQLASSIAIAKFFLH